MRNVFGGDDLSEVAPGYVLESCCHIIHHFGYEKTEEIRAWGGVPEDEFLSINLITVCWQYDMAVHRG